MLFLDGELRVVAASRAFDERPERLLGRSIYDLPGSRWDVSALRRLLEASLADAQSVDDYSLPRESERDPPLRVNARRMRFPGDDDDTLVLAFEESALSEPSTERLALLDRARANATVRTAVVPVVTTDPYGKIEAVNDATERVFGYARAELVGSNVSM